VIDAPPSLDGAVHDTVTELDPNAPETPVGMPGVAAGTTAVEIEDAPDPALFAARTVNV
jgi:hypothetical protein